ncbi:hypothetical protein [Oceanobacillus sojae]|uniref:hypothetical protein n=1 Tax=Oceanobacillus sojae TaxID=582851 RepID=UPI003641FA0E
MKVTSLVDKRKQKAMNEMVVLPVYEAIHFNEDGELIGKLVDYKEIPRYILRED